MVLPNFFKINFALPENFLKFFSKEKIFSGNFSGIMRDLTRENTSSGFALRTYRYSGAKKKIARGYLVKCASDSQRCGEVVKMLL